MAFELKGPAGQILFDNYSWRQILALATDYGWVPAGTGPPGGFRQREWIGIYFSNDGQLIHAQDGRRIAAALGRFLKASARVKLPGRRGWRAAYFFSQEGRQRLEEFIAFSRQGSFRVY